MRKALGLFESFWLVLIGPMPGAVGDRLRRAYYRPRLLHLGEGVRIDVGVQIVRPEHVSIGDHVWIDKYAVLMAGPPREGKRKLIRRANPDFAHGEGDLVIGPNTHVAPHTVINGHGGVQIDGGTTIAAGAMVYSLSHHHRNLDDPDDNRLYRFSSLAADKDQVLLSSPVVLREGAAIALNCVVLPGSTVGRDAWVTVGSTVRGTIPDGCLASGSPAAAVRSRE
jgi:acetyltransferase-like isoleucine patch superfamily enzyme